MHDLLHPALALRRLEREHQIGGRGEAHLPGPVGGEQPEGNRQVRLADAARVRFIVLISLCPYKAMLFCRES